MFSGAGTGAGAGSGKKPLGAASKQDGSETLGGQVRHPDFKQIIRAYA